MVQKFITRSSSKDSKLDVEEDEAATDHVAIDIYGTVLRYRTR